MTEELEKEIAKGIAEAEARWNSMTDKEKKKALEEAEECRFWEDWTDMDPTIQLGQKSDVR